MSPQMIIALKKKYNKELDRFNKATNWMEAPERTEEEIEKYFPSYLQITKILSAYLNRLKEAGVEYTTDEVVKGFSV